MPCDATTKATGTPTATTPRPPEAARTGGVAAASGGAATPGAGSRAPGGPCAPASAGGARDPGWPCASGNLASASGPPRSAPGCGSTGLPSPLFSRHLSLLVAGQLAIPAKSRCQVSTLVSGDLCVTPALLPTAAALTLASCAKPPRNRRALIDSVRRFASAHWLPRRRRRGSNLFSRE